MSEEKEEKKKSEEKPEEKVETKANKEDKKDEKAETKASEEKKTIKKKSKKKKKKVGEAVVNIYTSFNNTLVHVTDLSGNTIAKMSGGVVTKHDRLKANPTIAMFIAKRISEQIKDLGIRALYFRIRAKTGNPAPGPGAHAIIKSLSREGFKILNILDTTRAPRGGPKVKGGRRGRRP